MPIFLWPIMCKAIMRAWLEGLEPFDRRYLEGDE